MCYFDHTCRKSSRQRSLQCRSRYLGNMKICSDYCISGCSIYQTNQPCTNTLNQRKFYFQNNEHAWIKLPCIRLFTRHVFCQFHPKTVHQIYASEYYTKFKLALQSTWFSRLCQSYANAFFRTLLFSWTLRKMYARGKKPRYAVAKKHAKNALSLFNSSETSESDILI